MNQTISPADDDPRQRRALARFAAVQMVLQARQRGLPLYRALQEAAQQPWDGRFYAADTIEEWVYRFEHGNFPALYDQRRRDQGTHRALDPAATEALLNLRRQYPDLTLPALTAELLRLGILQPGTFSASTLQRRLVAAGLDRRSLKAGCLASGPTKAFELPLPNLLWMADGMHGPGLKQSEGSTLRTFLFALTQAAQASPATGRCRSIARSSTPQAAGNCRPRNPRAACLTHSRQQFSFWPCQPRRSVTRESGFVPGMPLGLRASDFFCLSAGLILPHQVLVGQWTDHWSFRGGRYALRMSR